MSQNLTRRRYTRFSLRTLLLVMTVLCIWLGIKASAARQQRNFVDSIIKAGGTVTFDYQMLPVSDPDEWKLDLDAQPPGPAWLRKIVGDEYFRSVTAVILFSKSVISENDFAQIANFRELKQLMVLGSKLVPEGSNIPRLIQDADLAILNHLQELRFVQIEDTAIEGACLAGLADKQHLRFVGLDNSQINDSGMIHIGKVPSLRVLTLRNERVTDDGLKHLKSLTNLEQIDLQGNNITDAGLPWFREIPTLQFISLKGNQITSEGIPELSKLTQIKFIRLAGTRVTRKDISELQKSLPAAHISGP